MSPLSLVPMLFPASEDCFASGLVQLWGWKRTTRSGKANMSQYCERHFGARAMGSLSFPLSTNPSDHPSSSRKIPRRFFSVLSQHNCYLLLPLLNLRSFLGKIPYGDSQTGNIHNTTHAAELPFIPKSPKHYLEAVF